MYAMEKAQSLYAESLGFENMEMANKLLYLIKAMNDLALLFEGSSDEEFKNHVKMIINEGAEEYGLNSF